MSTPSQPSGPSTRHLLRETVPIAAILAVWIVPTAFVPGGTAQALLVAGLVMAALYAIVRGTRLARGDSPTTELDAVAAVLRENGRLLGMAAVWFLAAVAVRFGARPLPGVLTTDTAGALAAVLNWTAVGMVLLYAVTVGRARIATDRTGSSTEGERDASDQAPVDG